MDKRLDEDPGVDGPDYVALVIEWDEMTDALERGPVDEISDEVTTPLQHRRPLPWIAAALGALGAIALAGWGIHRYRSA
jgi:hypothetical protein